MTGRPAPARAVVRPRERTGVPRGGRAAGATERRPVGALEGLAQAVARWTGTTAAFVLAAGAIVAWAASGPLFHYSENWQLVINTGTTIVTFLMVFLIQRSQNKEARAVQLKLSEIVAALDGASNRMIGAEDLSEAELDRLAVRFQELQRRAEGVARAAVSIEDLDRTRPDLPPGRRHDP